MNHWIPRSVGVVVFFLWSAMSVAADDPLAGLDEGVSAARAAWGAPGLAVAVVKNDEVAFMKGYGTTHLGRRSPVDENTLFTLASTTKAFVAVSIGLLVDEGRLHWDDRVIEHIPEFRVADPYVTNNVTIRDLLAHRTGVEPVDILWLRGFDTKISLEHLPHARQAAGLRSTWIYNNVMYMVAAEVVARVSGMAFEDFVIERLFEPLGMSDTVFTRADVLRDGDNLAGAHMIVDGETIEIEPYLSTSPLGAAGIHSSVADMTKWLRFLLNEGTVGGKRLLGDDTLAEILKAQMLLAEITYPAAEEASPHFFAYGLGWFLQDYHGRLLAMHTGSLFGANALVAIVPEEELGMVIFINAGPVEYRHAFMYDIVDRFTGKRGKDWSADLLELFGGLQAEDAEAREEALNERDAEIGPSGPLTDFAGTYEHPLAGPSRIDLAADGELVLEMQPDAAFRLSHWGYDSFEASNTRAPGETFLLTFMRGGDGSVTGYEIADERTFERRKCADGATGAGACE